MIYTVTMNPSLDYIIDVANFTVGEINRTTSEKLFPGGKGINVSIVLHNLGIETKAFGFTAGFTGKEIKRLLKEKGIPSEFIEVEHGISRINVKLRSNEESEINGQGPSITQDNIHSLYKKLDQLTPDDMLVLAGSIPSTLPTSLYMDIMKYLKDKNIKIIVDATKDLLKNVLQFHPFMVKPNNHELGDIFGIKLNTKAEVIPYAKKLCKMGAQNVLISMAEQGAVLISADNKVYEAACPKGNLVNSVGAGDSMVAGFITGYLNTGSYMEALKTGLCAGTASACSEELATKEQVGNLIKTTNFNF
ncbi:MAG: 1-phosphofructokinase [Treponema sp. CETP13]|nr:MAG: 1-phosphofructokinase [Treponema sp. CETP13]